MTSSSRPAARTLFDITLNPSENATSSSSATVTSLFTHSLACSKRKADKDWTMDPFRDIKRLRAASPPEAPPLFFLPSACQESSTSSSIAFPALLPDTSAFSSSPASQTYVAPPTYVSSLTAPPTPQKKAPPPTPRRNRSPATSQQQSIAPYPITSIEGQTQVKIGELTYSVNLLAGGDYHDIYVFDDEEGTRHIDGTPLDKLIVKVLKQGHWQLGSQYINNQLIQHATLKGKMNVIPYLNQPVKDGFFISPFIATQFPKHILVTSEEEHKKLSKEDFQHLSDLKDMFTCCVANNTIIDLKPDNLRIDDKGKLILIDLYEEKTGDELVPYINRSLRTFAEGNSYLRAYLISDIQSISKNIYKLICEE